MNDCAGCSSAGLRCSFTNSLIVTSSDLCGTETQQQVLSQSLLIVELFESNLLCQ